MLSLGFGPLFVMAAAFKQTRGWFNGWLNMTLGFGMSYVVIMFCTKILLTILDKLWFDGTSWITVFSSLFVCIALSIVIARMGDIASAWFGAGNIADGTAAAAAVAMGSMGGRAKRMAQTVGENYKAYRKLLKDQENKPYEQMNRYNTRHAYNQNRKQAAEQAKAQQQQNTSIKKGK